MIVVFGSVNVDFVTRVEAIPHPGETVLGPKYDVIPGGKGANQALSAQLAGSHVYLIAAVGDDPFAAIGLKLLEKANVDCSHIARVAAPTGAAFITVDRNGENIITVASGANAFAQATDLVLLNLEPSDTLLMQREVPEAQQLAAARIAKERGARVIVNVAPAGPIADELLALVDILLMNEHEALVIAEGLGLNGSEPDMIARDISASRSIATIVTLGAEGAIGWTGGVRRHVPAFPVEVVDTTAAGDAFCGAFAAALDQGFGFTGALTRGVAAGSFACTRQGAQPSLPTKAEISQKIKEWAV